MMWPWCEFRMQVWNMVHADRWKYRTQKLAMFAPSHDFVGLYLYNKGMYRQLGKMLNGNISATCPHTMVNFGPLTADIDWRVWGSQQISTGFASWFCYCSGPRAGSGAVSKWVICACDSLVDFGAVWMWLICIFVVAYLSYLYFSFFLFYASYLLFYFFFYLLPSRILDPLRFQAGGCRRRPNLGLVCI